MKLIIDVGNTKIKLALFQGYQILSKEAISNKKLIEAIQILLSKNPTLKHSIISSVGNLSDHQLSFLRENFELFQVNHQTKIPFINLYKTPKTLGIDRICIVAGAKFFYPKENALIIDAGTCVTYDFVTKKGDYLGGGISPGLNLRYKSLNNYTANLPLLKSKIPKNYIGDSTEQSIHVGVALGLVNEIDGVIYNYKKNHSNLTVILTGGDANFLSDQLKNSIFVHSDLLVEGLNFIFEFNQN